MKALKKVMNLLSESFKLQDGDKVIIGGIISTVNKKVTKNNE